MKLLRAIWRRIFESGHEKAPVDTPEFGISLSGQEFTEDDSQILLEQAIDVANEKLSEFADAFHGEWTRNPPTAEQVVLGFWMISAWRHLRALVVLADSYDLTKVSEVHYRSILEIFLQVRYFLQTEIPKRDRMAQKVRISFFISLFIRNEARLQWYWAITDNERVSALLGDANTFKLQDSQRRFNRNQ